MFSPFKKKASSRRQAIREDRVEAARARRWWRQGDAHHMLLVAAVFALLASLIQLRSSHPLPFREGQYAPMDLRAPIDFIFYDPIVLQKAQEQARASSPPVLVKESDALNPVIAQMNALRVEARQAGVQTVAQLRPATRSRFPDLTDAAIRAFQQLDDDSYKVAMNSFATNMESLPLVVASDVDALRAYIRNEPFKDETVTLAAKAPLPADDSGKLSHLSAMFTLGEKGVAEAARADIIKKASIDYGGNLPQPLAELATTLVMGLTEPTYKLDLRETARLADRKAAHLEGPGTEVLEGSIIVSRGRLIEADKYRELQQAQEAFETRTAAEHPWTPWFSRLGYFLGVLLLTAAGSVYIARVQKDFSIRRAWAVCGLLLLTLVLARGIVQYAPQSLYLTGIAPTLLTAIILVIAYNQRFALGVSALQGLLVTFTLGQGIDFYLATLAGSAIFCFGLNEIRTRGKLIEVGAAASLAVFVCLWVLGATRMMGLVWSDRIGAADIQSIWIDSLWGAGAGIIVAMFALAVLPSIERIFRITTAMTLLELCDANKPLLVRLSQEAPGTFNHSLTVGIMAEAAGNAVSANGLLCRVGAYYHDVGKLSKPQYFIENQAVGQPNRHDRLSPAMSLLIIVGHVKDGIELAREYALPWVVHQFIAQHHGTTLVEYFYHAARRRAEQGGAAEVSDTEFRYPGPRPQSREAAIIMICDGCESSVRAIEEPTAGRIETAVHNLIMKRLMDGQFSECDLTLRDLSIIEETLLRTLAGIHHGRVAYPGRTETPETGVATSQSA